MKKEIIMSSKAPAAIGPYSHGNKAGNLLFVSGQLPIKDGEVMESIKDQTRACLENLGHIINEAGATYEDVVKVNVFLKDMSSFAEMNEVYAEFFKENCPARSCVAVKGLPKDVDVEIEAIAMV